MRSRMRRRRRRRQLGNFFTHTRREALRWTREKLSTAIARRKEMTSRVGEILQLISLGNKRSDDSRGVRQTNMAFLEPYLEPLERGSGRVAVRVRPSGSQMAVNERKWRRKRERGKRDGSHFVQGDLAGFSPEMRLITM